VCKQLADAGADVVGLNCIRGPSTMLPLLRDIRAAVKTPMAALPVPYRTHDSEPTFQSLCDTHWHYEEGSRPFPIALDPFTCNRFEIADFARRQWRSTFAILGVCCGAGPHHIRALAEAVGKHPPASKYSADMSKHAFLGSHERIKKVQKDYATSSDELRASRGEGDVRRSLAGEPSIRPLLDARVDLVVVAGAVHVDLDLGLESGRRIERAGGDRDVVLVHGLVEKRAAALAAESATSDIRRFVPLEVARLDEPQRALRSSRCTRRL
jgi:hypothetical protein